MRDVVAFALGLAFAVGLGISGMTSPAKVLAFLDVFSGHWDPSLILVMAGGLAVGLVANRLVLARSAPLFDTRFHVPDAITVDVPLVAGAAMFGIGWGLSGVCPGPGIVGLASGHLEALVFCAAMSGGMLLHRSYARAVSVPVGTADAA